MKPVDFNEILREKGDDIHNVDERLAGNSEDMKDAWGNPRPIKMYKYEGVKTDRKKQIKMSQQKGKLTDNQYLFCIDYFKNANASKAGNRLGYADSWGSKQLQKGIVKEYLESLESRREEVLHLNKNVIIKKYLEIVENGMQKVAGKSGISTMIDPRSSRDAMGDIVKIMGFNAPDKVEKKVVISGDLKLLLGDSVEIESKTILDGEIIDVSVLEEAKKEKRRKREESFKYGSMVEVKSSARKAVHIPDEKK